LGLGGDVSDRDAASRFVDDTLSAFGRLDVLANNAQITRIGALLDVTDDDGLEAVWRSGFVGTLLCMQAAFPHLREQRGA
jgi:NAD(P)-dependent dehydrogenase (short-subunit alcohol dehydrogenase family)